MTDAENQQEFQCPSCDARVAVCGVYDEPLRPVDVWCERCDRAMEVMGEPVWESNGPQGGPDE